MKLTTLKPPNNPMPHAAKFASPAAGTRGHFYDVRNLPYAFYGLHPMEVLEYQRGRPSRMAQTSLLNRNFKAVEIPLNEATENGDEYTNNLCIDIVQKASSKMTSGGDKDSFNSQQQQAYLVFSLVGSAAEAAELSIPETQAVKLVQRLRILAKWKTDSGANLPSSGQGLVAEDAVFKAQILQPQASQPGEYAIRIYAETRSRDPQERRELGSVLVPMRPACLTRFKAALNDLVVKESPLYHTKSMQASDGSRFYLDCIKEDGATAPTMAPGNVPSTQQQQQPAPRHFLKLSHVTRDFRSIVIVPACDVPALRDLLDASLRAMTQHQQLPDDTNAKPASGRGGSNKRKNGRSHPRRRKQQQQRKRRGGSVEEEKENNSAATAEAADAPADVAADDTDAKQQRQQETTLSSTNDLQGLADRDFEDVDGSTVESRPVVENEEGSMVVKAKESAETE